MVVSLHPGISESGGGGGGGGSSAAPKSDSRPSRGKPCTFCATRRAVIKLPRTGQPTCCPCFYQQLESRVHTLITTHNLFPRGSRVCIAASGGKDSTVLAHILKTLNDRHDYGLDLMLLSIDEGITGYRDDSLETVKRNELQYDIPLKILSYKDLYQWSMDDIVRLVGLKNNCTFCGVFRRQALDRGAALLNATHLVTGHNADDIAETVILNFLRGDVARLRRCASVVTKSEGTSVIRCKLFKDVFEKEIVMYAYFKKLDYFSTECTYSENAHRGTARSYIKELEKIRPTAILDIIKSADKFAIESAQESNQSQRNCQKCGYMSSQMICKACVLLEGLNSGMPMRAVGKKAREISKELRMRQCGNEDGDCGCGTGAQA